MTGNITVDDIQIGGTADIKYVKNGAAAVYPAVLQKSRIKSGFAEYRVHYKNWNKRYDEWVRLDRIVRVYDEDGNLLKNVGSESDGQNSDSSDEEKPLNQKISLRNISKGQKKNKKEEEDDDDDEDQPLAETSLSGPKTRGTTTPDAAASSALDGLGSTDSDTVSESEDEGDGKNADKNRTCHANCGKNAQEGSIYCSVECILKHAMKEKAKEKNKSAGKKSPDNDEVPPPLEPADPDVQSGSSGSDGDFVPPEDKDQKQSKKTKKTKKASKSSRGKKIKSEPVQKSPKVNPHNKKLTSEEIDEIMKKVDNLATDAPIMVMRQGALLTGFAAPRKSNLRKFLEDNPVGTKVIFNEEKPKSPGSLRKPSRDIFSSQAFSRDKNKKIKPIVERKKPIARVEPVPKADQFEGASTLNPYARKEIHKKTNEKEIAKQRREESKTAPETKRKKLNEDDISGKDLLKSIKKAQKEGRFTGKSPSKDNAEKKPPAKKRLSSSGEAIGDVRSFETPTKTRKPSLPERNESPGDQRSQVRQKLREVFQKRLTNAKDLKMDLNSVTKLVRKIEVALYNKFKETNKHYSTKFRQIYSNLNDRKNDFFWRKVIQGEITTSSLCDMEGTDMASEEKIKSRKKLEKEELEEIIKLEEKRQKEALKPTAKITHKGEIEIENTFDEPLDKSTDNFAIIQSPNKDKDEGSSKEKEQIPKKEKKEKKVKKKDIISQAEMDTINRMMTKKTVEPTVTLQSVNDGNIDDDEAPRTPEYYPDADPYFPDTSADQSQATIPSPEHNNSPEIPTPEEEATTPPLRDYLPESVALTDSATTSAWSGKVVWGGSEASNFSANGYIISGDLEHSAIRKSLPSKINIAGRLEMGAAEKYIREVRNSSEEKRISILSLYGKSDQERTAYIDSLTYLSQKNKVGVVNNAQGVLKDVYLIPVLEDREVPEFLRPLDGIGLQSDHPAILLIVLIKKSSSKKKSKPKISKSSEVKEKTEQKKELKPETSQDLPKVPKISNDLFNTIKETLNNPHLTKALNSVPEPSFPAVDGQYSAAPIHSNPPPTGMHGSNYSNYENRDTYRPSYRPEVVDDRDRDRRTYRSGGDDNYRNNYQPTRTSHWDNNRGNNRHRDGRYQGRSNYRNDRNNDYRRDDRDNRRR